jgi:hypothetical protein
VERPELVREPVRGTRLSGYVDEEASGFDIGIPSVSMNGASTIAVFGVWRMYRMALLANQQLP